MVSDSHPIWQGSESLSSSRDTRQQQPRSEPALSVLYSPAALPCSQASVPLNYAINYQAGRDRERESKREAERKTRETGLCTRKATCSFSFYQAPQAGNVRNTKEKPFRSLKYTRGDRWNIQSQNSHLTMQAAITGRKVGPECHRPQTLPTLGGGKRNDCKLSGLWGGIG